MALASAGCEISSSSFTAGPRPELPGLWAAELASVASTQALQRAWQAGLRGRRQRKERLGTSQEQAGLVRKWLRSNEARAVDREFFLEIRPFGGSCFLCLSIMLHDTTRGGGSWWSCQLIDPSGWGVGGMAGHAGPPVGPASDVWCCRCIR